MRDHDPTEPGELIRFATVASVDPASPLELLRELAGMYGQTV